MNLCVVATSIGFILAKPRMRVLRLGRNSGEDPSRLVFLPVNLRPSALVHKLILAHVALLDEPRKRPV
jgi:hypothetical protein